MITLIFDGLLVVNGYRQVKAQSYAVVEGRVTHSEVTEHHDDDGTTYGVDVRYTYQVAGRRYECDRYRYGQISSSDNSARKIVASLPVQRAVQVHYNPADPADALLKVGLEGSDFFMALFLTPFNLVMLGGWAILGSMLFGRGEQKPAGGAKIVRRGFRTIVRRPSVPSIAVAGVAMAALAFVLIFVIGFGLGFNPSLVVMKAVWGAVLGVGFVAYFWSRAAGGPGKRCLEIDEIRRTLTLPGGSRRNLPTIVSFGEVEDVVVEAGRSQGKHAATLVYHGADGTQQRRPIVEMADPHKAKQMATWLKQVLTCKEPS